MIVRKLTSFSLGAIIAFLATIIISGFIDYVLEPILWPILGELGKMIISISVPWIFIILILLLFYFSIDKSMNFKQKIIRVLSFIGGPLFLLLLFGIGAGICYEQGACLSSYNIIILGFLGIGLVYLIFRFVDYIKNKNTK